MKSRLRFEPFGMEQGWCVLVKSWDVSEVSGRKMNTGCQHLALWQCLLWLVGGLIDQSPLAVWGHLGPKRGLHVLFINPHIIDFQCLLAGYLKGEVVKLIAIGGWLCFPHLRHYVWLDKGWGLDSLFSNQAC